MLRIGQTFVNRAASDGSVLSHLWIIVSDPAKDENAVIANLTTMDPGTTDPCVVKPADHPFISRASVIAYDYVKIRPCNGIEKLAACGMLSPSRDLSPALLARVQGAIGASPIVANEVKDMLRAQGFI